METQHVLKITPFIRDEVRRQGHNIEIWADGGIRVMWMLMAWANALAKYKTGKTKPTIADMIELGQLVEPIVNKNGERTVSLRVGTRMCPSPEDVPGLITRLWGHIQTVRATTGLTKPIGSPMTADDFYVEFEMIHPFTDGNGRVGKILHNWLLGTLEDPVLVADYFGGGNP